MFKVFRHFRPWDWLMTAVITVLVAAQVWLDLKLPDYMSEITMLVQTKGSAMGSIYAAGGNMLLCALGSLLSSVLVGFLAARVATRLSMVLRSSLFCKVQEFSMEEINRFSTASLITRSTNDVTQLERMVTMGLQLVVRAPMMAVWAIVKISGKSWQWSAATAIGAGLIILMIALIMVFVLPKFKKIQKLTDNINRITRENLTGLRVVRAYNAENYQQEKFEKENSELTNLHLFTSRMLAVMSPVMTVVMYGLTLSIYWIGAYLINAAGAAERLGLFSDMVVFSSYAMQVIMAFLLLVMIYIMWPRAAVSAERINEVLETKVRLKDGNKKEGEEHGTLEFKNVSFRYPDAGGNVLTDISFTAKKGETVAIIGATGSGKSSLVNLIPRFYDATEGEVLIDGVNVKEYRLSALRKKIGFVAQRAVMFSGSVAANIAYGCDEDEVNTEMVEEAAEVSQAGEFVNKMEGGYGAQVARGGTNLSGGQKQRLSIARAVYRDPEIYVFDDSFSALDYKTDRVLRTELRKKAKDATTVIVAQRIGTIKDADRIIVLDSGKIAGMGRHEELMANCAVYREIAYSQLSKEELENAAR